MARAKRSSTVITLVGNRIVASREITSICGHIALHTSSQRHYSPLAFVQMHRSQNRPLPPYLTHSAGHFPAAHRPALALVVPNGIGLPEYGGDRVEDDAEQLPPLAARVHRAVRIDAHIAVTVEASGTVG